MMQDRGDEVIVAEEPTKTEDPEVVVDNVPDPVVADAGKVEDTAVVEAAGGRVSTEAGRRDAAEVHGGSETRGAGGKVQRV